MRRSVTIFAAKMWVTKVPGELFLHNLHLSKKEIELGSFRSALRLLESGPVWGERKKNTKLFQLTVIRSSFTVSVGKL